MGYTYFHVLCLFSLVPRLFPAQTIEYFFKDTFDGSDCIPCLAVRPSLVSEDGRVSDMGDIMLAELAEVVRLRGVKCPVSAGPGGFRINTVYNGLKLILNKRSSFLSLMIFVKQQYMFSRKKSKTFYQIKLFHEKNTRFY